MPFDPSGNYALPAGSTAVTGTTILAVTHNSPVSDIAAALSQTLVKDGRAPMTGNLQMGTNRIVELANGSASTDAATVGQIDDAVANRVRYDAAQTLTDGEKTQARTNVGAQANLGFTPVNKAGDTMTGSLGIEGSNPNYEINRFGIRTWQTSVTSDGYYLFWDESFSQPVLEIDADFPDIRLRGSDWFRNVYDTQASVDTKIADVVSRVGTGDYAEHALTASTWFHAPTGKYVEGMRPDGTFSILSVATRRIYQNVPSLGGWQPASEV